MYCEHCGKGISPSAAYCGHCGLKANEGRRTLAQSSVAAVFEGVLSGARRRHEAASLSNSGGKTVGRLAIIIASLAITTFLAFVLALVFLPKIAKQLPPATEIGEILYLAAPNATLAIYGIADSASRQPLASIQSGEGAYAAGCGLQEGAAYAFRVLDSGGRQLVPVRAIGQIPSGGKEGCACLPGFNPGNGSLPPGDYSLELIRAEGKVGLVVSGLDFSVS